MQNKVFWKIALVVLLVAAGILYVPKFFNKKEETTYERVRRQGRAPTSTKANEPLVRVTEYEVRHRDGSVETRQVEEGTSAILLTSGPVETRPAHLRTGVSEKEYDEAFETFVTTDDVKEKEVAINAIANFKEKSNKEFLIDVLRDTSEDGTVRAKAAKGLGFIGALDATPYLLEAMEDPGSGELRASAYAALRKLTGRSMDDFDPYAPADYRKGKVDLYRSYQEAGLRYPPN